MFSSNLNIQFIITKELNGLQHIDQVSSKGISFHSNKKTFLDNNYIPLDKYFLEIY